MLKYIIIFTPKKFVHKCAYPPGIEQTGHSAAGIIHFLNKTPISWLSKKLNTFATSTYGFELSVFRIVVEQVMSIFQDLCYL